MGKNNHFYSCDVLQMRRHDVNMLLTGTFFCVIIAAESFPRTAMAVLPPPVAAFMAYSVSCKAVTDT
jgi:hypothetical protein